MLDIILLLALVLAAIGGWRSGAIAMLVSLVVLIAAAFVASVFAQQAGNVLRIGPEFSRPVIGFFFLFAVLLILGSLLKRFVRPKSGLARGLDQTIGAVLGVARGVLILSFLLLVLSKVALPPGSMTAHSIGYRPILESSTVIASVLRPLMPSTIGI